MLRALPVLLSLTASSVSAAPPSPLARGVVEHATPIITVPQATELDAYVHDNFTDDVRVFENDKQIATSASAWRAYLEAKRNFGHKVKLASYGNPIIVAESTWLMGNECCLSARVVTYHLRADGKVDEVRIITNGSYWWNGSYPE